MPAKADNCRKFVAPALQRVLANDRIVQSTDYTAEKVRARWTCIDFQTIAVFSREIYFFTIQTLARDERRTT